MALETLHLINFLNEILLSSFFVCATNRQRRLLVSAEHKIKATNQKIAAGRLKTEESCLHHLPTLRGKKIVQRFLFVGRGNNSRRRTANFISFLYIHRPVAEFCVKPNSVMYSYEFYCCEAIYSGVVVSPGG